MVQPESDHTFDYATTRPRERRWPFIFFCAGVGAAVLLFAVGFVLPALIWYQTTSFITVMPVVADPPYPRTEPLYPSTEPTLPE